MTLAKLMPGISPDEFFRNFWELSPVIFPERVDPESLYSIADFESKLTESGLRLPTLRVVKNGSNIAAAEYTHEGQIGGMAVSDLVDIPSVYRLWNEGSTLVLQSLHTGCSRLIDWIRSIEAELGHPVQVNAYLTPSDSKGLGIHYDTHDVFVIQIDGRKHWRVWSNPTESLPLQDERAAFKSETDMRGTLFFDGVLEAGQILYMPRGYFHEAETSDSHSLHLTIGALVYRRLDALRMLLDSAVSALASHGSEQWRRSLPPGYMAEGGDPTFEGLKEDFIRYITKAWGLNPTTAHFAARARTGNQRILGLKLDSIVDTTSLEISPGICALTESREQTIGITYSGRFLELPIEAGPAIAKIMQLKNFRPEDLFEYTRESRIGLCRRLLLDGFIRRTV